MVPKNVVIIYPTRDIGYYNPQTGELYIGLLEGQPPTKITPGRLAQILFHEHGHLIDSFGLGTDTKSYAVKDYWKDVKSDYKDLLLKHGWNGKKSDMTLFTAETEISQELMMQFGILTNKYEVSGVSDLMFAVSNGQAYDGYKHPKSYFKVKGNKQAEAFANMFASLFNTTEADFMREYFPKSYERFRIILGDYK